MATGAEVAATVGARKVGAREGNGGDVSSVTAEKVGESVIGTAGAMVNDSEGRLASVGIVASRDGDLLGVKTPVSVPLPKTMGDFESLDDLSPVNVAVATTVKIETKSKKINA